MLKQMLVHNEYLQGAVLERVRARGAGRSGKRWGAPEVSLFGSDQLQLLPANVPGSPQSCQLWNWDMAPAPAVSSSRR